MRRSLLLVVCAAALSPHAALFAQTNNPLTAPLPPPRYGAEAGLNVNQQSGSFLSDCGCEFPTGSGTSFYAGAVGEMHVTQRLALMGRVTMHVVTTTSTNTVDSMLQSYDKQADRLDTVRASMQEKSVVHLTYLQIAPMVRFDILKSLFIAAGPALGLALSSNLHSEESTMSGYTFLDGSAVRFPRADGPVPGLSGIRLSIAAMLGYEIPLSLRWSFIPTAALDFPLTPVTSGTTWKISSYQIAGAVRWKVHL